MLDINELLATVKRRANVHSRRKLGALVDVGDGSVMAWEQGRTVPTDDKLVKLCELAGLDPIEYLILVKMGRAQGEAKECWQKLHSIYNQSDASPFDTKEAV